MTEDHPKVAQRDWRLHAITTTTAPFKSAQTGFEHPVGTVVELAGFLTSNGETFSVPVADAAAMFLSLASSASLRGRRLIALLQTTPSPSSLASNAIPIRRVDDGLESDYINALQELVATVIFTYTSIEALANQLIPAEHRYRRERSDGRCTEEFNRDQIERYVSLPEKLSNVLPRILNVQSPRGNSTWERFVRLKRLRDRLVHLKRSDWRSLQPSEASTSVWTDIVAPDVPHLYKVAVDLAAHFTQHDKPRWVRKAEAHSSSDAA